MKRTFDVNQVANPASCRAPTASLEPALRGKWTRTRSCPSRRHTRPTPPDGSASLRRKAPRKRREPRSHREIPAAFLFLGTRLGGTHMYAINDNQVLETPQPLTPAAQWWAKARCNDDAGTLTFLFFSEGFHRHRPGEGDLLEVPGARDVPLRGPGSPGALRRVGWPAAPQRAHRGPEAQAAGGRPSTPGPRSWSTRCRCPRSSGRPDRPNDHRSGRVGVTRHASPARPAVESASSTSASSLVGMDAAVRRKAIGRGVLLGVVVTAVVVDRAARVHRWERRRQVSPRWGRSRPRRPARQVRPDRRIRAVRRHERHVRRLQGQSPRRELLRLVVRALHPRDARPAAGGTQRSATRSPSWG